jgi:hypothetical protein
VLIKKLLYIAAAAAVFITAQPLFAASNGINGRDTAPKPLYPVSTLIAEEGVDSLYPSIAGDFMVYGKRKGDTYNVVRVSKHSPKGSSYQIKAMSAINKDVNYGVAISDGSIGYVSNRVGPISAWMWQGQGEGHVAIGNMATYRGGIAPFHLNASIDGQVWCFDSTFQKKRYNVMLNEFSKYPHREMMGQQWRTYHSDHFRYKQGYYPTQTGTKNKYDPPVLFVLSRKTNQLVMIPNAYDGAISPDGRRVVFVRETDGNYDLWMQDVDGSELVQLTSSEYGDFEPAWSPDGEQLVFISNRDAEGDVRKTSIYTLELANNSIRRLTNAKRATDGGPAWFDEHTVVFHSNRSLKEPQKRTQTGWNIWQVKLNQGK